MYKYRYKHTHAYVCLFVCLYHSTNSNSNDNNCYGFTIKLFCLYNFQCSFTVNKNFLWEQQILYLIEEHKQYFEAWVFSVSQKSVHIQIDASLEGLFGHKQFSGVCGCPMLQWPVHLLPWFQTTSECLDPKEVIFTRSPFL